MFDPRKPGQGPAELGHVIGQSDTEANKEAWLRFVLEKTAPKPSELRKGSTHALFHSAQLTAMMKEARINEKRAGAYGTKLAEKGYTRELIEETLKDTGYAGSSVVEQILLANKAEGAADYYKFKLYVKTQRPWYMQCLGCLGEATTEVGRVLSPLRSIPGAS